MAPLEPQFHGTPRFRIVSRIGVGAAGELYKAMDESRGSFVALRTLRSVSRRAGESLRHDFEALKAIRNPGLVSLGELDCIDGLWFYTMEFIEGHELIDYVRPRSSAALGTASGELSELRLRSAFTQLVRAVHALHRAGRTHGNIEPEHIRVTPQGRLVLLECELWGSRDDRTSEQRLLTALPFVAPERLEDAPSSPAADWYSVGAVLYQALSGSSPFSGSGADLLEQKQKRVPPLPRGGYPNDFADLCRDLLAIDPDARPDYDEIRDRLGAGEESEPRTAPTLSAMADPAPFIGRKRELGLLAEAFERTRHGAGSTLCLHGEAGLGKRTLATQLARKLRNEYPHLVHLTGRCEPEGPRAYRGVSGVMDALGRYLAQQDASTVATLLPSEASLIARIFPALARVAPARPEQRGPREPRTLRSVTLRAVRTLLSDLSKRAPMLVTIDEAQWIDQDTLIVLEEILRPPDPPNMLLLLLVHGELGAADPPLREWLSRHEQHITMMRLKELSPNAARELAEVLLRAGGMEEPHTAERIALSAGGRPLRIDALARHALLTGSAPSPDISLDELIRARAGHLPLEARQLLAMLCHARVPVPPTVAAQATQLPLDEVNRQAAVLRVANLGRLLRNGDVELLAPSHSVVRHAVLAHPGQDRKRIHRRIAEALSAWPAAPKDVLASHLRDAGHEARATLVTARAADEARDALAFGAAVQLYLEALQDAPSEESLERHLRIELARAYASAGQTERSARAYFDAARRCDHLLALELERQAAHQQLRSGLVRDGVLTLENVLARLGVNIPRSPAAALLSLASRRFTLMLRGTSLEARPKEDIRPEDELRADVLASMGAALSMIDSVRSADAQTRYLLLALKLGDASRVARALSREAALRALTSEPSDDSWVRVVERSEALADQTGDPEARAFCMAVRALVTFVRGSIRDTIQCATAAEQLLLAECPNHELQVSHLRVLRGLSGFLLGELKSASERVEYELREAEEYGEHYSFTSIVVGVGYQPLLMRDEPERALELLGRAHARLEHDHFYLQHLYEITAMTQVELYTRDGSPYSRLMAAWPQFAKALLLRLPTISYALRHLRARAGIAQARSDREERELLLRDAADSGAKLAAVNIPYVAGWGHAARAGVDALRGDRERAIQRLEQAEAAFYEGEMTLYAAAARYQLGRLLANARGRELRAHAQEWFEAQGVKRVANYIGMLLPGFD